MIHPISVHAGVGEVGNNPPDGVSYPKNTFVQDLFLQLLNKSPFQKGDLELLTDKAAPPRLIHREKETEQIVGAIAALMKHSQPSNLFIYGKSGTGKTAVAKNVLEEVERLQPGEKKIIGIYVNCSNNVSHHALLRQLITLIGGGENVRVNEPASSLHDRLLKACQEKNANIVFILDEVGRLVKKTGFDAMYSLSNMNSEMGRSRSTITLVAISNDLHFGERLDPAVQSRLGAQKLYFAPYTDIQLRGILQDRAELVFADGGLENGVIPLCAIYAAKSHGDARVALSLLRMAAVIAGREGAKQVQESHASKARAALELDIITDGVRQLTLHEKLVLYAVSRMAVKHTAATEILNSGKVVEEYGRHCAGLGMVPLGARSVSMIMDDLAEQGLVRTEIRSLGRARGRTTVVYLNAAAEPTIKAIEEDSIFEQNPRVKWAGPPTGLDRFGR